MLREGAHFIALCDAFGLPLISADRRAPAFYIVRPQSATTSGAEAHKLIFEWGHASACRGIGGAPEGFGLGYFAMNGGRAFDRRTPACLASGAAFGARCRSRAARDRRCLSQEYMAGPIPRGPPGCSR